MDAILKKLVISFLIVSPSFCWAEVIVEEGIPQETAPSITVERLQTTNTSKIALKTQENRGLLEKQLRDTEISISNLSLKMAATKKELTIEKNKITQLSFDENQLNDKLIKEKQLLKKQVVLSYRIGDNSLLKALLTQNNLAEEEKTNVYVKHLNQAQLTLAEQIKQTLISIQKTKQDLQTHTASLEALYNTQKNEQQRLEKNLQSRKALLASL